MPIAAIVFIWQLFSLPSMKTETRTSVAGVFLVLKRPVVALGMAAVSIFFMGQFALFTYLRPFLETVEHVDVSTLSLVLLMMGVTGFVGTSLIGAFLKDRLYRTIITIPVIMALIAGALVLSGTGVAMTTLC